MVPGLSLERALMAVEKVRERRLRSVAALERHGVPYAVIGGHAVAVWVARVDEDAVRNTADVDILLRREGLSHAAEALAEAGFDQEDVHGVTLFLETANPSRRRGIHVVFAGERVRPDEPHPAPDLSSVARADEGFAVLVSGSPCLHETHGQPRQGPHTSSRHARTRHNNCGCGGGAAAGSARPAGQNAVYAGIERVPSRRKPTANLPWALVCSSLYSLPAATRRTWR